MNLRHSSGQHFVHISIVSHISSYYNCLLICLFLPLNYDVLQKKNISIYFVSVVLSSIPGAWVMPNIY